MPKLKINADRVSWLVPSPVPNSPPTSVTADFGAIVDIPEDEANRLREVRTRRFYTDPATGVPAALARLEPVVLDPGEREEEEAQERERIDAEVADLQRRIAELQANRPPTPVPAAVPTALPVTLSPVATGVRVLPAEGTPRTAEEAAAAGMPAPLIDADERARALAEGRTPEAPTGDTGGVSAPTTPTTGETPLAERNATDLINILREDPTRADEIEAAERSRPEDRQRSSVIEAAARARTA